MKILLVLEGDGATDAPEEMVATADLVLAWPNILDNEVKVLKAPDRLSVEVAVVDAPTVRARRRKKETRT